MGKFKAKLRWLTFILRTLKRTLSVIQYRSLIYSACAKAISCYGRRWCCLWPNLGGATTEVLHFDYHQRDLDGAKKFNG